MELPDSQLPPKKRRNHNLAQEENISAIGLTKRRRLAEATAADNTGEEMERSFMMGVRSCMMPPKDCVVTLGQNHALSATVANLSTESTSRMAAAQRSDKLCLD